MRTRIQRSSKLLACALWLLFPVHLIAQANSSQSFFEKEIVKFELWDKENSPEQGQILFIGSSSFRLWKDVQDYFPGKNILNRGFGGSQTSDVLEFKERIILPYQPSQVVIYVGENDIAAKKSPKSVFREGKKLFRWITKNVPDAPILYVSMKPSVRRWELRELMQETNAYYRKYASKKEKISFINVWDAMLGENGQPKPGIFIADGLHMNATGYALWKELISPHLN